MPFMHIKVVSQIPPNHVHMMAPHLASFIWHLVTSL